MNWYMCECVDECMYVCVCVLLVLCNKRFNKMQNEYNQVHLIYRLKKNIKTNKMQQLK